MSVKGVPSGMHVFQVLEVKEIGQLGLAGLFKHLSPAKSSHWPTTVCLCSLEFLI